MSGLSKIKKEVCVHGYESVWLNRWTRRGRGFELQARSNRDVECSTKINGQLWKESTGSMKLEGKMLSGFLDLFPNPDSAVQRVEMIPDMNKEPPIVADRENSIDEEGESSSSATQTRNVKHFLNNNNKLFKESKLIRLDHETNSKSQFKRLKLNSSDYSGNGTKGMMVVEEGPSQEKVNYFFNRILRCGINKSGSTRNQERFQSRIKNLKMGGGRRGQDEDFTLLHPWIQRWCKKKAAEIHEQGGGQEVNPKGTTLKKQFPSIAAMALMGKALSLTPTGMKKTNSLFVWNAKELR